MNGFGMECRGDRYGMRKSGGMDMRTASRVWGMEGDALTRGAKVTAEVPSCWVECFVRGDDSYGYGFALWSPFGFTEGEIIRRGRKMPMMRELSRGCTVRFTVTPTMNGEELPVDDGRIEFVLKGFDGTVVEASSSTGDIEVTAEQMNIPEGRYAWAVRWVRSDSVHMLGTGKLDVTKNIFMED